VEETKSGDVEKRVVRDWDDGEGTVAAEKEKH